MLFTFMTIMKEMEEKEMSPALGSKINPLSSYLCICKTNIYHTFTMPVHTVTINHLKCDIYISRLM